MSKNNNFFTGMGGIISWHSDRILRDSAFSGPGPMTTGKKRKAMTQEPSTGENTRNNPWASIVRDAARGMDRFIGEDEDVIPYRDRKTKKPQKKRRRDPTPSESEDSSDSDTKKPRIPGNIKGLMPGSVKRTIELQFPVYLCRQGDEGDWFFNFSPSNISFNFSQQILYNIYLAIPKNGDWPLFGVSAELQMLRRCFRHIKIDNVSFSYYNDNTIFNEHQWTVPTIGISITADKHPQYTDNDFRFLKDNYIYDNSIYYQAINTDFTKRYYFLLPEDNIQDINKTSIGQWQTLHDFDQTGLVLNLGQSTVSTAGPDFYEVDTHFPWCRIGYVSVYIDCSLGTSQGEIIQFL